MRPIWLCALFLVAVSAESYKFAIITDLHVGHHVDTEYAGQETAEIKYLEETVNAINARAKADPSLKWVFVMGDLTDKAQPTQLAKVAELLQGLQIPYLPLIGNHDLLHYSRGFKEAHPTGDERFAKTFAPLYAAFPASVGTVQRYAGATPVPNPEQKITSYFHNFVLEVGRTLYIALDWNSRGLGPVRAATDAQLHDFPGGTYQWLEETLSLYNQQTAKQPFREVVILQHHPFHGQEGLEWYATFTEEKKQKVRSLVERHVSHLPVGQLPPLVQWKHEFAGHIHRWYNGTAFPDVAGWQELVQWETSAVLKGIAISYVTVADGSIADIQKATAAPAPAMHTLTPEPAVQPAPAGPATTPRTVRQALKMAGRV
eukprot:GAFH01002128.1.p2 GENE.GAFH01002128.1~~GAFH01002128.1.p2  ORF type:complete len:373 (-),score=132.96 GAFH01002128.1:119-1237(-)